ncbi:MAG: hypothetical protein KUG79_01310 [Pseudomonadales bacterium]|nr:hypothetical protein [Pseudomonadales bacterium]
MKSAPCHYLVNAIYIPRIEAYIWAVIVTLSQYFGGDDIPWFIYLVCVFCLLYPHLMHWLLGRFFNTAAAARSSLLFDGLLVGLMVVVNQFYLFASVSFVMALALSSLAIARPRLMLLNLMILGLVSVSAWQAGVGVKLVGLLLTDILCAASILFHGCMVAYLGFRVTFELGSSRRAVKKDHGLLVDTAKKLSRYISPQIYSSIASEQQHIKTFRKRLTVFFSDLEGFTELMDTLEEETVTLILNEYLNTMAKIAVDHGGTVDKFIGDGIMVFFGDPDTQGARQDALACARMALEMQRQLKRLRSKWRRAGIYSDLHMRIGIHSGFCAVGNFGSEARMDYTAVGSTVNIASRLEGQAGRDSILISGASFQLVEHMLQCEQQPPVRLKGIKRMIENYHLLGELTDSRLTILEQNITGMEVSINPDIVDCKKARHILTEITNMLDLIENKAIEPNTQIRLLK